MDQTDLKKGLDTDAGSRVRERCEYEYGSAIEVTVVFY
jgi:hypothetical protein